MVLRITRDGKLGGMQDRIDALEALGFVWVARS